MSEEIEVLSASSGTVALLTAAEIDQQIATAHKWPRSIKQFQTRVLDMVTISDVVAAECIYTLPRDDKTIQGPSARFAEVVANAWRNNRAGARVVNEGNEFITAQGVFMDLEANAALTYEVQRRITTSRGKRFGADMIGMTANAACSIALRNAILKGVPKAFWASMFDAAKQTALGDIETLPNRRAAAYKALKAYGVTAEQIFAKLGVAGAEDVGREQLIVMIGWFNAIKEGDSTPEELFGLPAGAGVAMPKAKSAADTPAGPPAGDSPTAEPPAAEPAVDQPKPDAAPPARAEAPPAAEATGVADEAFEAAAREVLAEDKPVVPMASASKVSLLKTRMKLAGLGEHNLQARFDVKFDGITQAMYAEVVKWIESAEAGGNGA